jgi:hypothetical protein
MWQRIQSVFLGLVILSLSVAIFMPIWVHIDGSSGISHELYPLHYTIKENGGRVSTYFPYAATAILMVAAITLAVMEIQRYKDRVAQVKIGTLNSLILAGVMISSVVFANQFSKEFTTDWKYGLGLYLPFVAVTCNWLAIRFIRRDDKLVRDSDRLR